MERLTKKSADGTAVWFIDHEKDGLNLEPCEMEYQHSGMAIRKLAEYEDLEEQGKLLIKAYEICEVSECMYCGHVERRIEETWIRPDLLEHDGFYRTIEEAEIALKEIN